ncbi:substrate-binding domain-containing protein [Roseibium sp.]|uniref:substrate-binding domain-containing protein n=1 Tax=Roseibium sp. TaxID=1936156 RepID=UPI0032673C8D
MPKYLAARAILGGLVCLTSWSAEARDRLLIVGSSTVFPFATAVAEKVGEDGMKFPIVESTGTGGGFDLFCEGAGVATPDITNASRRMKPSEFENCRANGVTPVEVVIGYDGIVLANSREGPKFALTLEQIFEALAEKLPRDGAIENNPNLFWSDIDASLPAEKIEVLGPPPTSGTRDAFEELAMEEGCEIVGGLEADLCTRIRHDGSFVEAGENDDLIVGALTANPVTVGIFGYSFLAKNSDQIQSVGVNAVDPSFENIASGKYPLSRPLYFYIKKEHVGLVPGIEDYVAAFTSEEAWGDDGYLAARGLIPLAADARLHQAEEARALAELHL